jgi:hypothetical protein
MFSYTCFVAEQDVVGRVYRGLMADPGFQKGTFMFPSPSIPQLFFLFLYSLFVHSFPNPSLQFHSLLLLAHTKSFPSLESILGKFFENFNNHTSIIVDFLHLETSCQKSTTITADNYLMTASLNKNFPGSNVCKLCKPLVPLW